MPVRIHQLFVALICLNAYLAIGFGQTQTANPRPFGSEDGTIAIPSFGDDTVQIPFTSEDLERGESLIDRYDDNQDGYLSAFELQEGSGDSVIPWTMISIETAESVEWKWLNVLRLDRMAMRPKHQHPDIP